MNPMSCPRRFSPIRACYPNRPVPIEAISAFSLLGPKFPNAPSLINTISHNSKTNTLPLGLIADTNRNPTGYRSIARQSNQCQLSPTQVRETLALALEELDGSLTEGERPEFWEQLWERYVESKLDYKSAEETLQFKRRQAGADCLRLLKWLEPLSTEVSRG